MSTNTLGIARVTKTFRGAEGCKKNRVLVNGAAPGECQNAAAANAANLAGVSFDSAKDGEGVALSEHGYQHVEVAGPVALGARLNVAADGGDASLRGRVKAVSEVAGAAVTLVGIAEEAATAAGTTIRVNIRRFGEQATA